MPVPRSVRQTSQPATQWSGVRIGVVASLPLLALLSLGPFFSATLFPLVFALYAGLVAGTILIRRRSNPGAGDLFWLVVGKSSWLILMVLLHRSNSTLINCASIIFTDMCLFYYVSRFNLSKDGAIDILLIIYKCILATFIFGLVVCSAAGSQFNFSNPVLSLISGERVLLFMSSSAGHSILVDYSVVLLALALPNVIRLTPYWRTISVAVAVALLLLTRSSIALIEMVAVFGVYAVYVVARNTLSRAMLLGALGSAIVAFSLFGGFDDAMYFVRVDIMGRNPSEFRDADLTAGRAELNSVLLDAALASPFAGEGNDSDVLVYGLALYNPTLVGSAAARTESSLRLAVKYGFPYFAFMLLIILYPIKYIRYMHRNMQIFTLSCILAMILGASVNASFEVPYHYSYPINMLLVFTLSAIGRQARSGTRNSETLKVACTDLKSKMGKGFGCHSGDGRLVGWRRSDHVRRGLIRH